MSQHQEHSGSETWENTRERVLNRDNNECRFCGIGDAEHREKYDRGLSAHHIIPKSDGGPDRMRNLITVCRSCHRTLESTHAKAVAQLTPDSEEIKAQTVATYAVRKCWAKVDRIDDSLGEFFYAHPTFRTEFALYDEGSPESDYGSDIESRRLQNMIGEVSSEWAFLVNYGYKRGLIDSSGFIENWGMNYIDDEALEESDLPDPDAND